MARRLTLVRHGQTERSAGGVYSGHLDVALTATGRGFHSGITAGLDSGFVESTCVSCGACADTCPTDAITEHTLLDMAAAYTGDGGTA